MPLAFGAGLGGTITLIGTPPNMLANVALEAAGMPELKFGFLNTLTSEYLLPLPVLFT